MESPFTHRTIFLILLHLVVLISAIPLLHLLDRISSISFQKFNSTNDFILQSHLRSLSFYTVLTVTLDQDGELGLLVVLMVVEDRVFQAISWTFPCLNFEISCNLLPPICSEHMDAKGRHSSGHGLS